MSLAHQSGALGAPVRFFQRTYVAELVALGLVATAFTLIQIFVTPFHRMFYIDDMSIQYPFTKFERVPLLWSIIYSAVFPVVCLIAWSIISRPSAYKFHITLLALISSLMTTPLITDIIKNTVGRPRPDLISRCRPQRGTPEHELLTISICTQTNEHLLQEGWRSFPSGHSSFAFAGLGFLTLFLAGQLRVFRPRADLGRCLLAFAPTIGALMIAISRLGDYRHDVWDVSAGSILGSCIAYFTYRRYYPALTDRQCDTPYDRADDASSYAAEGFSRLPNDEERALGPQPPRKSMRESRDQEQRQGSWESPETIPLNEVVGSQSR
ncbi:uncharacterized protein TRUGW13939_10474 [Talaromyces rugulosus]|uniref:Phosphatidic acid phosphatase type 2/haloperoxidase domain-containing protein n=1 Tax=Talaromyces rugulosus TaxID=121627 RepID=A0A7H8RCS4_TALRU|nr:uncharacterized protein TRUGW13939_10474 [Talaromyces rugulosus]QKX63305.1 hypothetical protein TRUGW13939_10474 [Talaromyces rugulosus]